jgi:hypothetical protein
MRSRPVMFVVFAAVAALFGFAGAASRICTTDSSLLGEESVNVTVPQRADLLQR